MVVQDKVHKCLNPVAFIEPVETFPLAPRLDTLDGKTIHLSITGEPDTNIALEKRLKNDYPDVNWTVSKSYTPTPVELTEEEMKTTDGLIQSVCW